MQSMIITRPPFSLRLPSPLPCVLPCVQVVLVLCTHLDLRGRERKVLAEVLQNCFKAVNFASQVGPV